MPLFKPLVPSPIADAGADDRLVLGSWVGVRRLLPPFLIPHRVPIGSTQAPSTDTLRDCRECVTWGLRSAPQAREKRVEIVKARKERAGVVKREQEREQEREQDVLNTWGGSRLFNDLNTNNTRTLVRKTCT